MKPLLNIKWKSYTMIYFLRSWLHHMDFTVKAVGYMSKYISDFDLFTFYVVL